MDYEEDFRSAQFALLSKEAAGKLKRAVPAHEIKRIIEKIFTIRDSSYEEVRTICESQDPMEACFQALRERRIEGNCHRVCTAPAEHFLDRRCAPIGEVLDRMASVISDIEDHLEKEDIDYVLDKAQCGEEPADDSAESGYTRSEMNFPEKKVVFFWPNDSLVTSRNRGTIFPLWNILLENLARNFTLTMPPPDPYTEIWKDFVLLQLEQADAVIVAPTPPLFQLYANGSPSDTVIGKDFDYRDQKSEFLMDYLRGLYDYSPTADSSSKRLRRLLPPTVLALAGNDLDEAYKWSGFVYNLPFEIEPLMAATYGLIMAL